MNSRRRVKFQGSAKLFAGAFGLALNGAVLVHVNQGSLESTAWIPSQALNSVPLLGCKLHPQPLCRWFTVFMAMMSSARLPARWGCSIAEGLCGGA